MNEIYIQKYRHDYIDLKLKWLIKLLDMKNLDQPINCIHIIEKIYSSQIISFQYDLFDLPDKFHVLTEYNSNYNVYLMLINKNKCSNFALAHELGHIILEHLIIPNKAKTLEEIKLEEIEADEFARRLIMPKSLI